VGVIRKTKVGVIVKPDKPFLPVRPASLQLQMLLVPTGVEISFYMSLRLILAMKSGAHQNRENG
jgi:hypothetical protein